MAAAESSPEEEKRLRLQTYLAAVMSGGPQPGADILAEYRRPMIQEEMDRDREAFIAFCRDRHAGETVIALGTGPSLRRIDLGLLRRFTTIGCNGIGHLFQPDYYVVLDPFIYGLHKDVFLACPGVRILSTFTRGECDVRIYYRYENLVGLAKDDIYSADNTGFVLVSMAYVMGATRVVLAGYDGYRPETSEAQHGYADTPVERNRVRYEWTGRAAVAKTELIREAFALARDRFRREGRELILLTESYLLGDILERISPSDLVRLPGRPLRR